jgi:hypothetical protein
MRGGAGGAAGDAAVAAAAVVGAPPRSLAEGWAIGGAGAWDG